MPFLEPEILRAAVVDNETNTSASSIWRVLALIRWANLFEVEFA
jgi:hypothetical protein